MSEVVERLRALVTELTHYPFDMEADDVAALEDAATEIERLEARVRVLEGGLETVKSVWRENRNL